MSINDEDISVVKILSFTTGVTGLGEILVLRNVLCLLWF